MKATSLRRALLRMPCCLLPLAATLAGAAEEEPVVDAASLVQPALLSGPGFSVDPHVELRGYMARFTLDTPYGPLQADSVEILAEREAELPALEALEKVTRSEAFLRAAGDRIGTTAKALANVVLHPIDSVTGIPAGVARYFSERLAKIGTQAQSASDRVARSSASSAGSSASRSARISTLSAVSGPTGVSRVKCAM